MSQVNVKQQNYK